MKKIVLLFLFFNLIKINAQEIKSFTDDYDEGVLTYDYFIETSSSEIIKHGKFKYQKKLNYERTNGSYTVVVTGEFKNGYRDGIFKYKIKMIDYPNNARSYTTKTTTAVLTYKDGMPNGIWKVNSVWKTRDLRYSFGKYEWTKYSQNISEYANTYFKNGVATGKTNYKNAESKVPISFVLNNKGFMVGSYVFKDYLNIFDLVFDNNGVLIKTIILNKSGEVESYEEVDEKMMNIAENYIKGNISREELKNKLVSIDTLNNTLSFLDYNYIFEKEPFIFREIGGDKTLSNRSSYINRIYKRIIQIEKISYLDLRKNGEYKQIGYLQKEKEKFERYRNFLKENSFKLTQSDKSILESDIELAEYEYKKKEAREKAKIQYKKNREIIKNSIFEMEVDNYFSGSFREVSFNQISGKIDTLVNVKKQIEDDFGLNKIGYINSRSLNPFDDNSDYEDLLFKSKESLVEIETKMKPLWGEINEIQELSKKADLSSYEVICNYDVNNRMPGSNEYRDIYSPFYGNPPIVSFNEERLYVVYAEVTNEIYVEIKNTFQIDKIKTLLKKSIQISNRIIQLKGNVDRKYVKNLEKIIGLEGKIDFIVK